MHHTFWLNHPTYQLCSKSMQIFATSYLGMYQKRKPLSNMNGKFMICHDLFISCMLQQFLLLYNCTMGLISLINHMYIFRIKTIFRASFWLDARKTEGPRAYSRYIGSSARAKWLTFPPS